MSKYSEPCIDILNKYGPLLSNEFNKYLVEKTGVNTNNARQIILRLKEKGDFFSTDPVRFRHNQALYYLPYQSLAKKLKKVLPDHSKRLNRTYQALIEEKGFLLWPEFAKVSGGVVNATQSERKTVDKIFIELHKLGIVSDLSQVDGIPVVTANKKWVPKMDASTEAIYKRIQDLSFNKQFTLDLLRWLEEMNLIGWNSSKITNFNDYDKGYNGFYFDAIGYTYLWGLYRTNKKDDLYNPAREKAGSPVVIESILHRETKRHDITGFIDRVDDLYGPIRPHPNFKIMPICFVDTIEKDAYSLARAKGIMIISIRDVFGTKLAESLRAIRDVNPQNVDPVALADILNNAIETGQDGRFGSLKGYVFNFLIASIFSEYGHKPRIGDKFKDPKTGEECECDIVVADGDDYIIICEVKGRNSHIEVQLGENEKEADSVKRFFERTCRIVKNQTGKTVIPIFITSASFSESAISYLNQKNDSRKIKKSLSEFNFPNSTYYNRKSLLNLFDNKKKYTEHKRILREFFHDSKR